MRWRAPPPAADRVAVKSFKCEERPPKPGEYGEVTNIHLTLKTKRLGDMENLPDPDVLALEIVENLEAGLNSFKEIIATLQGKE